MLSCSEYIFGQQALKVWMGYHSSQPRCSLGFKTTTKKIKRQSVLSGVSRERWRAASLRVSFLPEHCPACGLRAGTCTVKKTEVGAVEGSEGSDMEGVLLMASSTSDFWREVLKTPS